MSRVISIDTVGGGDRSFLSAADRHAGIPALLLGFAAVGILFMFLPGTLLGVWNLISISGQHAAGSIAPEFVQAHGHAQIFGWIVTFIIGIGYASLPGARRARILGVDEGWICLALWTTGVFLRWSVGMIDAPWRTVLPLGAGLELAGFLVFFRAVSGHRPEPGQSSRLGAWALPVVVGTLWLLLILVAQFVATIWLARAGEAPVVPAWVNSPMLNVVLWGFLVPFVWGFTARWALPLFGFQSTINRTFIAGYLVSLVGAVAYAAGWNVAGGALALAGSLAIALALRLVAPALAPTQRKTSAVERGFVRAAYVWLVVGAGLGLVAALAGDDSAGYVGASRHALTVGFLSTMVLTVGPRILPALTGHRVLFSRKLMMLALGLLTVGCTTRVVAQVLAYQGFSDAAWAWLPVSAVIELTAITAFAVNMGVTFARKRR